MGVLTRPHSRISSEPVSSPAPFRTAVPAQTGSCTSGPTGAGTIAVTPVRATPRPSGGSGSSRQTVTWPTVTPGTSAIESVGPGSSSPIRRPSSRRRGPRGAGGPSVTGGL